jgi:hypothetical protein
MKRFTLRTVLALIVFLALIMSQVMLVIQNGTLRREVEMHRGQLGYLVPVDESKVNLIHVPSSEEGVWMWRVHAPPGTVFDLGMKSEKIPWPGVDDHCQISEIRLTSDPRGDLITAALSKDIDGQDYVLRIRYAGGHTAFRIRMAREEFLDGSGSIEMAGQGGTKAFDIGKPIVLYRKRLQEKTPPGMTPTPQRESRGLMFWLVPMKR